MSSAEACTTFSIRGTTSHRTLWPLDNKSVAAKTGATGNTTPPHAVLSCNARRRDGVQAAQQHNRVVPRGMGCGSGLGRSTQPRATALQPTHHQLQTFFFAALVLDKMMTRWHACESRTWYIVKAFALGQLGTLDHLMIYIRPLIYIRQLDLLNWRLKLFKEFFFIRKKCTER